MSDEVASVCLGAADQLPPVVEQVAQGRVERDAWSPSDLFRDAGGVAE